ncbi:MAG: HU family DNA-binding protein [Oscillospiraceae bacterium]
MTKTELVAAIAEKSGLTKKDSEKALASAIEAITEAVASGEKVALVGFGTFEAKDRAERMGINPKTKEPMKIAASRIPAFKAGKSFKEAVAK